MEFNSVEKYGRDERPAYSCYIGVNYSIVWDVFNNKIPELYDQIQEVLNKE